MDHAIAALKVLVDAMGEAKFAALMTSWGWVRKPQDGAPPLARVLQFPERPKERPTGRHW